ncbi:protein kinase domain-containing protein [Rosistilla oblonga]|uniref:protein kinase domain-containing protein n=1 Tax=Rosistilla oblonga TaxID=2527990 RepID=UPI003A96C457
MFDRTAGSSSTRTVDIDSGDEELELDPPERIGRFTIQQIIGAGGFGTVYKAQDDLLHRVVAIKSVRRLKKADDSEDDRLLEPRAAARLSHPFLVPLYEVFQDEQSVYLVSEFCQGPTLAKWLSENPGPVAPEVAYELLQRLTDAIMHVHDRGLVHRDIKPSNILLEESAAADGVVTWTPRLTDFGLVRDLFDESQLGSKVRLIGTLLYMSPEQVLDSELAHGEACDIFSIGVVMYRLLTGKLPHRGNDGLQLIKSICVEQPPPPRAIVRTVPRDLDAICMRCLAKEPDQRYGSASELKDDLVRWRQGRIVSARPQTLAERAWHGIKRFPVESGLLAVIVLLVVASLLALAHSNRKLAAERSSLQVALTDVQLSERRAIAAEHDASAHQAEAEANRTAAVQTAYLSDLRQAYSAWAKNDRAKALNIAGRVEDYATGVVPIGFDLKLLRSRALHGWHQCSAYSSMISEVVLLPGQDAAAVADVDGTIRILDLKSGEVLREFAPVAGTRVYALAVSPDGNTFAVGRQVATDPNWRDNLNEVHFISLDDDAPPQTIVDLPTTVESLSFSPDGKWLAVGCRYEPIPIYDLATGEVIDTVEAPRRNEFITFFPDATRLLTLKDQLTPVVASLLPQTPDFVVPTDLLIETMSLSADGRWLVCAFAHETFLRRFDLESEDLSAVELRQSYGNAEAVAISPDGQRIVAGMRNGGIVGWDLSDPAKAGQGADEETELPFWNYSHLQILHNGEVSQVAIDAEGRIISGGEDGSVAISSLDPVPDSPQIVKAKTLHAVLAVDGRQAFIANHSTGRVQRIDTSSFNVIEAVADIPDFNVQTMEISPDGRWLAYGDFDGNTYLNARDSSILNMKHVAPPHEGFTPRVVSVGFNASGDQFFSLTRGGNWLILFDMVSTTGLNGSAYGVEVDRQEFPVANRFATLLGDNKILLFGEFVSIFDFATRETKVFDRVNTSAAGGICNDFSRKMVYIASQDSRIRSYDWEGRMVAASDRWDSQQPSVSGLEPSCITLTPDRRSLLTGGIDGSIAIWNVEDLQFVGTVRAADEQGAISDIGVSEDGKVWSYHQRDTDGKFPQRGLQIMRIQ